MDFTGLRYVVAVADAASFTRAAETLYVAQPALSRKIAQVEKEVGIDLFDRTGRRIQLTEAGQVFCRDARQVLSAYQALEQDMDQLLRRAESLRLICTTNGAVSYVARAVNTLRERYPSVEIYVQVFSSIPEASSSFTQNLELLRQGHADILLAFLPEVQDQDMKWLGHKCIEPGGLCAFVTQGHPLYGRESVCRADLRDETLVLPSNTVAPVLSRAVSRVLGDPPHVIYSPSFTDFRVRVVTENHIGIMPSSSRTIEDPFLRCLDIDDVRTGFDLEAVWAKDNRNPAIQKFLSVL